MHRRTFVVGSLTCLSTFPVIGNHPAVSAIKTSQMSSEEFLSLRLAINHDYAHGNVTVDDGWIVSATEFELNK